MFLIPFFLSQTVFLFFPHHRAPVQDHWGGVHRMVHGRVHRALHCVPRQVWVCATSAEHNRPAGYYPLLHLCHHDCSDWRKLSAAEGRRDAAGAAHAANILGHKASATLPRAPDFRVNIEALLPWDGHAPDLHLRGHGHIRSAGATSRARPGSGVRERAIR